VVYVEAGMLRPGASKGTVYQLKLVAKAKDKQPPFKLKWQLGRRKERTGCSGQYLDMVGLGRRGVAQSRLRL